MAQTNAGDGCDGASFERSAAAMRAALNAARAIPEEEGNTDIPPEAIKQIQEFKNRLGAALSAYFRCRPAMDADAGVVERDLYARLGIPQPQPKAGDQADDEGNRGPWVGLYLSEPTIKVEMVPDARKLVAVLTTFGIPYGQDAELDVFAFDKDGSWKPAVHLTSRPYDSIAGAFTSFDYRISPPDGDGHWFVAATHINPWPTSCWQTLFTDVVRPEDLGMQHPFFHHEDYGYICTDAPYLETVNKDGFQVRFRMHSMDEIGLDSPSVLSYKVSGDEVERVDPVALDPVNFVDEWARRSWLESRGWSSTSNLEALEQAHVKLRDEMMGDFVELRNCNANSLREVELLVDDKDANDKRHWFFVVREQGSSYRMERVVIRRSPSCRGRNRLSEIEP